MPELKLYTIAQLREWLEHNHPVDGLSEQIIAPSRAWAIIHNPYVKDDDPVLSVIYVGEENAAYVTAFPEMVGEKRYWWFSALWCSPKFEGNGYGLIVVGSLVDVYGAEYCLDRWGAKETVEIFAYFGHKVVFTPRYVLGVNINRSTAKGKLVYALRNLQVTLHRACSTNKNENYTLHYLSHIDDATYAFIKAHRGNDYFAHEQDYLNWILHYPFTISAPLIERVGEKMPFSQSEMPDTQFYAIQVRDKDTIIGFYIMKKNDYSLHILYIYYDESHARQVFASICDHVKHMRVVQCVTEDVKLKDYLLKHVFFPKYSVAQISFSTPNGMKQPQVGQVQYGDGDCFVA